MEQPKPITFHQPTAEAHEAFERAVERFCAAVQQWLTLLEEREDGHP